MSWFSDLFGGKKGEFNEYQPADYTRLRDLLYNTSQVGYPEIMNESYWGEPWRQTEQGIMEDLRGRRNLGIASTPEIAQRQFARAGLTSNLIGQNLGVRQNALNMLASLTPRPQQTYTPAGASGLENLLSFGAPLASTALSTYMGGNMMKDIFGGMGTAGGIMPTSIYDMLNQEPQGRMGVTPSLLDEYYPRRGR